uniref:Methylosome subunit pICln n=1 Tax=Rhinolophus ferrumequinum TaxID=59479 RepID=A0A671ETX9_RHIFE
MSFLKSFPPPESAMLNRKGLGTDILYVAEILSHLSWLDGSGLGFSLEYPTISLHAVSRDLNASPREHLYVMVNAEFEEETNDSWQGDIPTFYTYEEGLSHLTAEGQATLERQEGMLSQFASSQCIMAGVQAEDSVRDYEDGMEVDTTPTVAGQFEDAAVDH